MYHVLLKNANNEMKALKNLKPESKEKFVPIIESKRIKKNPKKNWEAHFNTVGRYLKERIQEINFIYDFNTSLEDLGNDHEHKTADDKNVVEYTVEKFREHDLNFIPCFQHDSPSWLVKSVINSESDHFAIRIRCHDFQETFDRFVLMKLNEDLNYLEKKKKITVILDYYNSKYTLDRVQHSITTFSRLNPSSIVFLSTACPEDAKKIDADSFSHACPRLEVSSYLELKTSNPELMFGDYATRLKGEVLDGFNMRNSYLKIFYTTESDYYIAKSRMFKNGAEESFHAICKEIIEQDFYPGKDFSFGDTEIDRCASESLVISDHQSPIAISVNHHIETTINQFSL